MRLPAKLLGMRVGGTVSRMNSCVFILLLLANSAIAVEHLEFFESKIRPLLVDNCYKCHSVESEKLKGGLLLDSKWGWEKGGDSGPVIVPGKPDESMLMRAVEHHPDFEAMPPKFKLKAAEIAELRQWISLGAPDPRPKKMRGADPLAFDLEARKTWWSLKPITAPAPPGAEPNSYDAFVRAKLREKQWQPAPPADRRTLIRRISYDLTGLPPRPAEIADFLADDSAGAYDKVVDRLLSSQSYGEHWARKWMDLVRYAETKAFEADYTMPHTWKYRDYLIRAFNQEVPYDQFVREHLAGDLLGKPRLDPETGDNESVKGPGYLHLTTGQHGPPDMHGDEVRTFDDMINVIGKTFLGTTISCARCHDHKFDAVTTADFYSLYGILASSPFTYRNAVNPDTQRQKQAALDAKRDNIRIALADLLIADLANKPPKKLPAVSKPTAAPQIGELGPGTFGEWRANGQGFTDGARKPGAFVVGEEKKVVRAFVGGSPATGDLSSRIGGSLQSPIFVMDGQPVHVRVRGRGARVNLIIQHYELVGNGPTTRVLTQQVKKDEWHWIRIPTVLWKGLRGYIDIQANGSANAHVRRGPHSYRHGEDNFVAVDRANLGGSTGSAPAPATLADFRAAAQRWRDGKSILGDDALLDALFASGYARNTPNASPALVEALAEFRELRKSVPMPNYVRSLADNAGADEPVYIRGMHKNMSKAPNPRRFLDAFDSKPFDSPGSGRLPWANAVASAENPLTARVLVNRLWYHMYGRGLVFSVDDFGKMGSAPSHPKLLDHLATEFIGGGWRIKPILRKMALSATYRMSSTPSADSAGTDPNNEMLQHMPVRRLHAEGIRDTILAVSGRLDRSLYGPSVPDALRETPNSRAKPGKAGPLDGNGRRSVYLELRRNFLPNFLTVFDMPNASTPFGRRNVTTVPAQSLALMNAPFVVEQAGVWAKAILSKPADFAARINTAHERAFGRPATAREQAWAAATFADFATGSQDSPEAWKQFCHIMLNRKALIYVF
jgi:hypothetical protein